MIYAPKTVFGGRSMLRLDSGGALTVAVPLWWWTFACLRVAVSTSQRSSFVYNPVRNLENARGLFSVTSVWSGLFVPDVTLSCDPARSLSGFASVGSQGIFGFVVSDTLVVMGRPGRQWSAWTSVLLWRCDVTDGSRLRAEVTFSFYQVTRGTFLFPVLNVVTVMLSMIQTETVWFKSGAVWAVNEQITSELQIQLSLVDIFNSSGLSAHFTFYQWFIWLPYFSERSSAPLSAAGKVKPSRFCCVSRCSVHHLAFTAMSLLNDEHLAGRRSTQRPRSRLVSLLGISRCHLGI